MIHRYFRKEGIIVDSADCKTWHTYVLRACIDQYIKVSFNLCKAILIIGAVPPLRARSIGCETMTYEGSPIEMDVKLNSSSRRKMIPHDYLAVRASATSSITRENTHEIEVSA